MSSPTPHKRRARARRLSADPQAVLHRLREGKRVRRRLDSWGRLFVDRPLPFLCVVRTSTERADVGTDALVTSQASYLIASAERRHHAKVSNFVRTLATGLAQDFGGFLLIELWSVPARAPGEESGVAPRFRLSTVRDVALTQWVDEMESALSEIRVASYTMLDVQVRQRRNVAAPGFAPLLSAAEAEAHGCHLLGIEVPAVYFDTTKGRVFPVIHRNLRRRLSAALKRAIYRFIRDHTRHRPAHYHALGPRSVTKRVLEIDGQLASFGEQFDFLLLSTPRNADQAWEQFQRDRFEKRPSFSYRRRPYDVALAKRALFSIPLERVEDPTLHELFREQQMEIDRKLTMISDRGSQRFRYESLQLFGNVEATLVKQAREILRRIPPRAREATPRGPIEARAFAAVAKREIARLKRQHAAVRSHVEIRSDISGLMVSSGNLLVGASLRLPASRVEALIQHEVGTHVLTHCNGAAQPIRQLRTGLPGYEELQEGLAVLGEYLVGGLSRPRLRLLAARVIAARGMLDGATFVEAYRDLHYAHGFERRTAFTVTMRVFRGGGHTKDAVYLRGLIQLLAHLREGHPLEPLYVGKIALDHLPVIEELRLRKVLVPPPLRPVFLGRADVAARLERARHIGPVMELVESSNRRSRT